MTLFQYILFFVIICSSGLLFFYFKAIEKKYLKLILSFTGAFLFGLILMDLLPYVFETDIAHIGIYLLAGFFLQLVLEYFSEGIEHGHIHIHSSHEKTFPFGLMIGLSLHSFIEAMPLAGMQHAGHTHLFWGILLHHIPVAFALVAMLMHSGVSKQSTLFCLLIFALMSPLGAFVSSQLQGTQVAGSGMFFRQSMAVVTGILLHISTTILFEASSDHRFNLQKLITVAIGAAVALLLHLS